MIDQERINEIVERVYSDFSNAAPEDREYFLRTEREDLIQFHDSLGRQIRNEFKLWETPHVPELNEHGTDTSPNHPDAISMKIIKLVWERARSDFHEVMRSY